MSHRVRKSTEIKNRRISSKRRWYETIEELSLVCPRTSNYNYKSHNKIRGRHLVYIYDVCYSGYVCSARPKHKHGKHALSTDWDVVEMARRSARKNEKPLLERHAR